MPNANYISGRSFEYRMMKLYQMNGFQVMRTAASHSNFDLIALRPDHITLMQLKAYEPGPTEMKREIDKLLGTVKFEQTIHIEKALVTKVKGRPVVNVNYLERYDHVQMSKRD